MPTIDQINDMTPAELETLNAKLGKKLMTRIAVRIALTAAIALAVTAAVNHFETKDEDEA